MKTEELALLVTKNGYSYKLVQRTDKFAIYEQLDTNHWEVFKIRSGNPKVMMEGMCARRNIPYDPERYADFKEYFPNDENFGTNAWCYTSLEDAQNKFNSLCQ